MKISLAIVIIAATGGSAAAKCEPPRYNIGQVWEQSTSAVLMSASLRVADFSPQRLVCLAEALKEKYAGRNHIDILIFSSLDAARRYSPAQADYATTIEKNGKAYDPHWFFARQLHAKYFYDGAQQEEYIDIKPMGSDGQGPYDTRIKLPVAATPHCRFEINHRCLLALEDIVYPGDALKEKVSGAVTLTGTIARDGQTIVIQVAGVNARPNEKTELLSKAALQNLKTWRFEEAHNQDALRITFSYVIDPSLPHRGEVGVKLALPNQVTISGNPPE